ADDVAFGHRDGSSSHIGRDDVHISTGDLALELSVATTDVQERPASRKQLHGDIDAPHLKTPEQPIEKRWRTLLRCVLPIEKSGWRHAVARCLCATVARP